MGAQPQQQPAPDGPGVGMSAALKNYKIRSRRLPGLPTCGSYRAEGLDMGHRSTARSVAGPQA